MSFSTYTMLVGGLLTLIIGFTEGVKCQYCNNDFVSVKRHEWRCKSRCTAIATVLHSAHAVASNQPVSASLLPDQSTTDAGGPPVDDTTCVCGRKCAGRRGLRAHERSCPVLKSLMKSSTDQATQPSAAAAHPPAQADDDITTSPRPPLRSKSNQVSSCQRPTINGRRRTSFSNFTSLPTYPNPSLTSTLTSQRYKTKSTSTLQRRGAQ